MGSQGLIKGTTYLLAGQCSLVVAGAGINIFLGRILGPSGYGLYSIVISIATLVSLVLISGIPKAASYYSSIANENSLKILKSSLILSLILSLVLAALLIIISPAIANFLKDQRIIHLIRLVATTLPALTILAVIQGYYNGNKNYKSQSMLTILLYSSRIILIILFTILNISVGAAIVGYTLSPIIPLSIALIMIGFGFIKEPCYPFQKIVEFALPVIVYSVITFLFLNLGFYYIKISNFNDASVGLYTAASTLSQLPYIAMVALNTSIFPAISSRVKEKLPSAYYIYDFIKYSLILVIPLIIFISLTSETLLSIIYSSEYTEAAGALSVLIIGISIFAFFSFFSSVISATGRPEVSMCVVVGMLLENIVILPILASFFGIIGVALATVLCSFTGLIITVWIVSKLHFKLMNIHSITRIMAAGAILFAIMVGTSLSNISIIFTSSIGGISYFLFLWFTKEITINDIERIKLSFSDKYKKH